MNRSIRLFYILFFVNIVLCLLAFLFPALLERGIPQFNGSSVYKTITAEKIILCQVVLTMLNSVYGIILLCRKETNADKYSVHWLILIQIAIVVSYLIVPNFYPF